MISYKNSYQMVCGCWRQIQKCSRGWRAGILSKEYYFPGNSLYCKLVQAPPWGCDTDPEIEHENFHKSLSTSISANSLAFCSSSWLSCCWCSSSPCLSYKYKLFSKVAQFSFQHLFGWVVTTTLYHLMLQSWYQKTAQSLVNTLSSFSWHNRLP